MSNRIRDSFRTMGFFCTICLSAQSQGTFQNLGFESAVLVSAGFPDPATVQSGPAFPGWTARIGTNEASLAFYNEGALDSTRLTIIDSAWSASPSSYGIAGPIEGNFTALLQAGVVGDITNPQDISLSQSGFVPSDAKSLLFKAFLSGASANVLGVTLGGQPVAYFPLATGTNYTLFAADIHQWAGQAAELDFTVFAQRPHQYNEYAFLDSIGFSASAIPEPSVVALFCLGALGVGLRILRKHRQGRHLVTR